MNRSRIIQIYLPCKSFQFCLRKFSSVLYKRDNTMFFTGSLSQSEIQKKVVLFYFVLICFVRLQRLRVGFITCLSYSTPSPLVPARPCSFFWYVSISHHLSIIHLFHSYLHSPTSVILPLRLAAILMHLICIILFMFL